MKPIVCLIVTLSLVFAFWPTGTTAPKANAAPGGCVVSEQLQIDRSPIPPWWSQVGWVEMVFPLRRRKKPHIRRYKKHEPGKLELRLRKFRRWRKRKMRQWRRLWQRRWEGMDDRKPVEPVTQETQSPAPVQETSSTVSQVSNRASSLDSMGQETVGETETPVRRGPGRPRTIPTGHVCCPNEKCFSYGIFGPDPAHDVVGHGTYTTAHGEKRQMFECKVCGKTFSETAGTPFFGLKTPMHTVCTALKELSEGLGVRAVARTHGVKPDTILEWIRKAGQHCEQVSEYMLRELELTQVQMDEMWTFVHKKQRKLSEEEKANSEWGDTWIWIAFDPIYKLVVAMLVGDRTEEEAMGLLRRLRARLAERPLPLFTSDSLAHYAKAILHTFGVWVRPRRNGNRGRFPKPRPVPPEELDYATVHKERKKGRVVSVTTQVVYGRMKDVMARLKPLGQKINTSYVERVNLTLRHLVSRLHRKTLCFSKKREYLKYHLHLSIAYYHFVLYHSSLRVRLPEPIPTRGNGSPKIWEKRTPAMAAGLTDHKWSMKELLMFHVPDAGC